MANVRNRSLNYSLNTFHWQNVIWSLFLVDFFSSSFSIFDFISLQFIQSTPTIHDHDEHWIRCSWLLTIWKEFTKMVHNYSKEGLHNCSSFEFFLISLFSYSAGPLWASFDASVFLLFLIWITNLQKISSKTKKKKRYENSFWKTCKWFSE